MPGRSAEGWVALLRGINLGPRNRISMAALRDLFESLGCGSVGTYVQSGNVVFAKPAGDRAALVRLLEQAIADELGVAAPVVLRTPVELAAVVASHPFGPDTSQTHVTFLSAEPSPEDVARLSALDVAPDEVEVVGQDVFVRYPSGVQGARLTGARLERHLGVPGTARNWRTVTRLAELSAPLGAAG